MNFLKIKGFTLIELLVVISIISLLISIIFAGIKDSRNKAVQSSALKTATSFQRLYSTDAYALYNFSGTTKDESVNQLTTTFKYSLGFLPQYVTGVEGSALRGENYPVDNSFYVTFPGSGTSITKFTISILFKPRVGINALRVAGTYSSATYLASTGRHTRVSPYYNSDGAIIFDPYAFSSCGTSQPITSKNKIIFNQWNHLAFSIDETNGRYALYVNGEEDSVGNVGSACDISMRGFYVYPYATERIDHAMFINNFFLGD